MSVKKRLFDKLELKCEDEILNKPETTSMADKKVIDAHIHDCFIQTILLVITWFF